MKLLSLVVENFRCFGQEEFNFTDETVIRAKNGNGKSSMAGAVVWCLYGTTLLGKAKADQTLLREGTKSMRSLTVWQMENGTQVTVERMKPEKGASKVFVNGNVASPGQIEGLFFQTVNEFLSVFIPGFFSGLEPKEAKAILARYSEVTPEQVLTKLLPNERKVFEGVRFGMGYDSIEVFRKHTASELKEAQAEKLRVEGEIRATEDRLAEELPQCPVPVVMPEHIQKAEQLRQQIAKVSAQAEMDTDLMRRLTKQRDQMTATLNTVQATLMALEENCPTCGQSLDEHGRRKVNLKVLSHNTPIQKHLGELERQRAELDQQITQLASSKASPTVAEEKIQKWRDYVSRVDTAAQRERDEKIQYDAKVKMHEKAKKDLVERKEWAVRQEEIIADLNARLAAVKAFRFRYVKMQQAKLDRLFDKVHIELSKVNEDGEMMDAFQIRWNKKPYQVLSTSERVRCDLEIGQALASLREHAEPMPVFVDNAEGVQDLFAERLERQAIAAYVFDSQLLVQSREEVQDDLLSELKKMSDLLGDVQPTQLGA